MPGGDAIARLAALRNLGPASARMLVDAGITSLEQLDELGAVEACRRVAEARGRAVDLNLAYAIEGALYDTDWRALPPGVAESLRAALRPDPRRDP